MELVHKHASIGIIGRGLAGLSMARALALRGFTNITIYGSANHAGTGSRAAVGVVTLKGWNEPRHPLFVAKFHGHKSLRPWIASLESDVRASVGQIWGEIYEPFRDEDQYKWIRERVYHRDFHGALAVEVCQQSSLPAAWNSRGAFHYWQDGWINPVDLCQALEGSLTRYHTNIISENVERLTVTPTHGICVMGYDGLLGQHDEVVLCAGIFTSGIARRSGIVGLDMSPVSGWTLSADHRSMTEYAGIFGKMAVAQTRSSLRFGSTSNQAGIVEESTGYYDRNQDAQITYLSEIIAEYTDYQGKYQTSFGVRARTKDRQPLVGTVEIGDSKRLWLLTGLYKNGMQLSHYLAESIADAWSFGAFSNLVKNFAPARISSLSK